MDAGNSAPAGRRNAAVSVAGDDVEQPSAPVSGEPPQRAREFDVDAFPTALRHLRAQAAVRRSWRAKTLGSVCTGPEHVRQPQPPDPAAG